MITVGRCGKEAKGVYIGNAFRKYGYDLDASPLGNPYRLKNSKDTAERQQVIANYRQWLLKQLESDSPQSKEIKRLKALHDDGQDLTLLCWCAPDPCHGDVIKEILYMQNIKTGQVWKGTQS